MKPLSVLLSALAFLSTASHADDHGRRVPLLPKYQQECSACHVAYPPGLLPAASWQRLMGGLERHFGSDASLDAASVREISNWLQANAGSGRRGREAPPEDRITRSAWFVREHSEELSPDVWRRAAVGSPANCAACHTRAAEGSYREREIRIPR